VAKRHPDLLFDPDTDTDPDPEFIRFPLPFSFRQRPAITSGGLGTNGLATGLPSALLVIRSRQPVSAVASRVLIFVDDDCGNDGRVIGLFSLLFSIE
jgi:hypothetical protein